MQASVLENLVNLRVDVAQNQASADGLKLLVQGDQLAESGTGQELDIAKVEQNLTAPNFIDQTKELFADDLYVLFVKNAPVHEVHHGHIADVLNFEPATTRGLRHRQNSWAKHYDLPRPA